MKARELQKYKSSKSLVNLKKLGSTDYAIQKTRFSIFFMNWEKKKVNIAQERPLFQNPNFESVDELGNLYPNLSWNNETMIGNSHKKEWSHFKLNLIV